jgi:hypothetical protein
LKILKPTLGLVVGSQDPAGARQNWMMPRLGTNGPGALGPVLTAMVPWAFLELSDLINFNASRFKIGWSEPWLNHPMFGTCRSSIDLTWMLAMPPDFSCLSAGPFYQTGWRW